MATTDSSISAETADQPPSLHLVLRVTDELLPLFCHLAEQGFEVEIQTGGSVREVLCRQLGIDEDYLDQRIQTIFLNAKAVDDVDSTRVDSGATLALSGAMPGLMGATLRKGGFFASLRRQISCDKNDRPPGSATASIIVKLFNLVAAELGPAFLQKGVHIKGQNFQEVLHRHLDKLAGAGASCELGQKAITLKDLAEVDLVDKMIFLRVAVKSPPVPL